jgi:hypothetical protein
MDLTPSTNANRFHWIGDHAGWFVATTSTDRVASVIAFSSVGPMRANRFTELRNSARVFSVRSGFGLSSTTMAYGTATIAAT